MTYTNVSKANATRSINLQNVNQITSSDESIFTDSTRSAASSSFGVIGERTISPTRVLVARETDISTKLQGRSFLDFTIIILTAIVKMRRKAVMICESLKKIITFGTESPHFGSLREK